MPSSEKREPAGVRAHLLEELVRSRRSGCVARSGLLLRLGPVGPFRSRCTTTLRARSRRVRLEVREPMLERERMGDLPCWSSVVLFRAWLGTAAVMIPPRHSLCPVRLRPQVITNGRSGSENKRTILCSRSTPELVLLLAGEANHEAIRSLALALNRLVRSKGAPTLAAEQSK